MTDAADPIYLDHNATTPLLPEVVDAMLPYLREHFGNASSSHVYGERAKKALARARMQVAAFIGCEPNEILFTSGGTEANNLAIRGVVTAVPSRGRIVTTTIEHPATARTCEWLERCGKEVVRVRVDAEGCARAGDAIAAIDSNTSLVTIMHSNNETGALQPVAGITSQARDVGAYVHTDAAQSLGKVPINVDELDVDLLSIAGHKLYAPKGVGALYVRAGTPLEPCTFGAGHERGLRPGTENVAGIVGLGTACDVLARDLEDAGRRTRALVDSLWARLVRAIPDLKLNGPRELRLPNTLNVRFPRVTGETILEGAPAVAASTGSACHEGHNTASRVIVAMGVSERDALGSVRLTLGRLTTQAHIERAAEALVASYKKAIERS